MIKRLREDTQYGFAFSNFRTKHSILKRKLGAEFAKKEWNVSSAGFGGDLTPSLEKRHNRKVSKYKTETSPTNVFATDSKPILKPAKTQFLPFDSIPNEVFCKSPRNLKRSSIEENKTKYGNPVPSKRPGSVFLEVQNIQSSFQKNNSDAKLKPLVELPSEFSKKFKAEILCNGPRYNSRPEITLSNSEIAQVKPYCKPSVEFVRNGKVNENKCTELTNIQSDLALKYLDNIQNTPSSFLNEKTIVRDFIIKKSLVNDASFFPIKSDLTSHQINDVQDIHSFTDNNSSNVCVTSKKLPEKVELFQRSKRHDAHNDSNSLIKDKFSEALGFSKKPKLGSITKKKFIEENVFQNSFSEQESDIKPPILLSPKSAQNFKSNLLPKRSDELENVAKKLKVDKSNFMVPSDLAPSNISCKVKKANISTSAFPRLEQDAFVPTIGQKSANEFAAKFEFSDSNARKYQHTKLNLDNESSFQDSSCRSEISLLDFSRLLENKSDGSKGSNWMQLLKPTLAEENEKSDHEEPIKKKIRNILPGGFAEQMQRLQRRENSEKVIWSHKIHRAKRTAQNDSLCLILNSISCIEDFIIAKAMSASVESQSLCKTGGNTVNKSALQSTDVNLTHSKWNQNEAKDTMNSDIVFVLFKRKAFARLQLKVNDIFKVYQPWQTFQLKCVPHPFILCAYFTDVVSSSCPRITNEENIPVAGLSEAPTLLKTIAHPESATFGDLLFFKRDELVSFSARIQRIWKKEFNAKNATGSSAATKYLRYSVLLQIKEGTIHELRVVPDASFPNQWRDVMPYCEGKCYRFHNLCVTHRVNLNKDKYLRNILETLHLQNESQLEQDFCYQLMFDSSSRCPEEIPEIGFPDYCSVAVKPLVQISKMRTCDRFTCIAKVLLHYKDVFYVSDESLLDSPSLKYVQVQLRMTNEVRSSLKGSIVLIKEALVEEGSLLIDNYSQLIPLFEASHAYRQLSSTDKSKVKNQADVCLKNIIQHLHLFSEVEDLACVKGKITNVDESTAFTWLQCSFCLQENLIQDTNLVIYCEDCSRIVPSPILNVKLEVVIYCPQIPSAKVNVQLLSTTIKRILQIPEGTYQPQCSVCDVLGKEVGPLYCYVQSCDNPVFYLSEVDST